jgi:membrane associated rhomboid family serine protease
LGVAVSIIDLVFRRQRAGSVICTSCGVLVGVGDDRCYNCGRWNPGLWGWAPAFRALGHDLGFVPFVIGTCIVIYGLTLLATVALFRSEVGTGGFLTFGSPSPDAVFVFGGSGAIPIFAAHRWWTVLSASWLHFGILHIFMNMMAVRQLAPAVADLFGPGRMIIIYVLGGVIGFVTSSLAGAFIPPLPILPPLIVLEAGRFTAGASASICGLIGAVLAYGHRSGSRAARSYAMSNVAMLAIMGFLIPVIDNYAHFGGLGGGYLIARALDPLKPERIDHLAIAVGLLAVSLLSVVVSVVHGLSS